MKHIQDLLEQQDLFFSSKKTLSIEFRKKSLVKLRKEIKQNENAILNALYQDLRKPKFEAYTSEIGLVINELDYFIKNIAKLSKPKRVKSALLNFPSTDYIYSDPYGRVLIMAPWNYPFLLVINPLIAAIASGNCVVCKPSEETPNTAAVIKTLIAKTFKPEHIEVIEGGLETNQFLLKQTWDYIFFTGSTRVGKIILKAAAEQLCPVTLELGGKSPVIVNKDASLELAAKRIIWGKLFNAGQTCIAPDYIYVHEAVKENLVTYLTEAIKIALKEEPQKSSNFARIVNTKHFDRITSLLDQEEVVFGGKFDKDDLFIEPTLTNSSWDSKLMQEEIFGPILPILTFYDLEKAIKTINKKEKPLAAYYFGNRKQDKDLFLNSLYFGGGCINDTLIHNATKNLPFGGVGASGIGAYHGAKSFDCFSHQKGIVKRGTWVDVPIRYRAYESKLNLVKRLFKYFS